MGGSPCSVVEPLHLWPVAPSSTKSSQFPSSTGFCLCSHIPVGTAGAVVAGHASLSSQGQLWLLGLQSSPGHGEWELGGYRHGAGAGTALG